MSYVEERYNIIKKFEGKDGKADLQPYVDGKGLITIGVGFKRLGVRVKLLTFSGIHNEYRQLKNQLCLWNFIIISTLITLKITVFNN